MNRFFSQTSCFSQKSRFHSTEVIFFTSWKLQLEPWKMPWEMPWKMPVRKNMYWNLVFFFVFIFHAISHGIFHGIFHSIFHSIFHGSKCILSSLAKRVISVKIMLRVKNMISVEKLGFLKTCFCAEILCAGAFNPKGLWKICRIYIASSRRCSLSNFAHAWSASFFP